MHGMINNRINCDSVGLKETAAVESEGLLLVLITVCYINSVHMAHYCTYRGRYETSIF